MKLILYVFLTTLILDGLLLALGYLITCLVRLCMAHHS